MSINKLKLQRIGPRLKSGTTTLNITTYASITSQVNSLPLPLGTVLTGYSGSYNGSISTSGFMRDGVPIATGTSYTTTVADAGTLISYYDTVTVGSNTSNAQSTALPISTTTSSVAASSSFGGTVGSSWAAAPFTLFGGAVPAKFPIIAGGGGQITSSGGSSFAYSGAGTAGQIIPSVGIDTGAQAHRVEFDIVSAATAYSIRAILRKGADDLSGWTFITYKDTTNNVTQILVKLISNGATLPIWTGAGAYSSSGGFPFVAVFTLPLLSAGDRIAFQISLGSPQVFYRAAGTSVWNQYGYVLGGTTALKVATVVTTYPSISAKDQASINAAYPNNPFFTSTTAGIIAGAADGVTSAIANLSIIAITTPITIGNVALNLDDTINVTGSFATAISGLQIRRFSTYGNLLADWETCTGAVTNGTFSFSSVTTASKATFGTNLRIEVRGLDGNGNVINGTQTSTLFSMPSPRRFGQNISPQNYYSYDSRMLDLLDHTQCVAGINTTLQATYASGVIPSGVTQPTVPIGTDGAPSGVVPAYNGTNPTGMTILHPWVLDPTALGTYQITLPSTITVSLNNLSANPGTSLKTVSTTNGLTTYQTTFANGSTYDPDGATSPKQWVSYLVLTGSNVFQDIRNMINNGTPLSYRKLGDSSTGALSTAYKNQLKSSGVVAVRNLDYDAINTGGSPLPSAQPNLLYKTAAQRGKFGSCFETLLEHCAAIGPNSTLWFNVRMDMTDSYMQAIANLCKNPVDKFGNPLNWSGQVILEEGNELWNFGFSNLNVFGIEGVGLGYGIGDGTGGPIANYNVTLNVSGSSCVAPASGIASGTMIFLGQYGVNSRVVQATQAIPAGTLLCANTSPYALNSTYVTLLGDASLAGFRNASVRLARHAGIMEATIGQSRVIRVWGDQWAAYTSTSGAASAANAAIPRITFQPVAGGPKASDQRVVLAIAPYVGNAGSPNTVYNSTLAYSSGTKVVWTDNNLYTASQAVPAGTTPTSGVNNSYWTYNGASNGITIATAGANRQAAILQEAIGEINAIPASLQNARSAWSTVLNGLGYSATNADNVLFGYEGGQSEVISGWSEQSSAYNSASAYAVNSVVLWTDGKTYTASQAVPAGTTPANSSYWNYTYTPTGTLAQLFADYNQAYRSSGMSAALKAYWISCGNLFDLCNNYCEVGQPWVVNNNQGLSFGMYYNVGDVTSNSKAVGFIAACNQ